MNRAQAILVIIALLSAPLALLARTVTPDMADCGGMCCLPHQHHHGNTTGAPGQAAAMQNEDGKSCQHGSKTMTAECLLHCGHAAADYGFSSPIAPTKPSNLASIERIASPKLVKTPSDVSRVKPGFLAAPFQPPRA
jgi:hypothetical protein